MARYNTNRYQYETSPRKLQPERENNKKKTTQKPIVKTNVKNKNIKEKRNGKVILYIMVVFSILFAISYRNALITQKYSEIKELKSELSDVEKENKQLEVNIQSKTNLGTIEQKAAEKLGLKKLDESQTVYVNLDKQDYVESSSEEITLEDNENWFGNIINKIKNIF